MGYGLGDSVEKAFCRLESWEGVIKENFEEWIPSVNKKVPKSYSGIKCDRVYFEMGQCADDCVRHLLKHLRPGFQRFREKNSPAEND